MSDNNPAMSGAVQAISLDAVNIGVGSYIINDYLLTVEKSEDGNGYILSIKKGSQIQKIHLTEVTTEYIDREIEESLNEAKTSGEFDGFSPIASITKQGTTATLTVTDASGTTTAELEDGVSPRITTQKDGDIAIVTIVDTYGTNEVVLRDGVSPRVEVSKEGTVTSLDVVDAYGVTHTDIVDGAKGDKGDKGDTGVSITSTVLNSDYTLTIRFSDGSSYTTPNSIRGPQGAQGIQGPRGIQGLRGEKGEDGTNGIDGKDGIMAVSVTGSTLVIK